MNDIQNPTLGDIERLCRAYADQYDALAERVTVLQDEIEAAKRKRLHGIKQAVAKAAECHSRLSAAIAASPHLFVKPKTMVINGVKVGFKKQPGRIEFDDAEKVVKNIRRLFPERFDDLVTTKETPLKTALNQLSAAELKRLGVKVDDDSDVVVVQSTASNVDKLVSALLAEAECLEKEAA